MIEIDWMDIDLPKKPFKNLTSNVKIMKLFPFVSKISIFVFRKLCLLFGKKFPFIVIVKYDVLTTNTNLHKFDSTEFVNWHKNSMT
jgi:hypothetical protein